MQHGKSRHNLFAGRFIDCHVCDYYRACKCGREYKKAAKRRSERRDMKLELATLFSGS